MQQQRPSESRPVRRVRFTLHTTWTDVLLSVLSIVAAIFVVVELYLVIVPTAVNWFGVLATGVLLVSVVCVLASLRRE